LDEIIAHLELKTPKPIYEEWEKDAFLVRYVIGAIAYTFIEFPLQKFWVFKK